ncbi:hypothetical protein OF83DRAFT_678648 [Amylostereum chailletii]|nr:hypothetical protein OF83DRAFT_678648 [Amylostereum chailletii]
MSRVVELPATCRGSAPCLRSFLYRICVLLLCMLRLGCAVQNWHSSFGPVLCQQLIIAETLCPHRMQDGSPQAGLMIPTEKYWLHLTYPVGPSWARPTSPNIRVSECDPPLQLESTFFLSF